MEGREPKRPDVRSMDGWLGLGALWPHANVYTVSFPTSHSLCLGNTKSLCVGESAAESAARRLPAVSEGGEDRQSTTRPARHVETSGGVPIFFGSKPDQLPLRDGGHTHRENRSGGPLSPDLAQAQSEKCHPLLPTKTGRASAWDRLLPGDRELPDRRWRATAQRNSGRRRRKESRQS